MSTAIFEDWPTIPTSGIPQDALSARNAVYLPDSIAKPAIAIGMRKIISDYTGSLIRLQRASDNAVFDVPTKANGLPNDDLAIRWAGGAETRIAIAYDQSGNGRHFVPPAWANMPLYDPTAAYGSTSRCGAFNSMIFDGWYQTSVFTRRPKFATWNLTGAGLDRGALSVFDVVDPKSAIYNQNLWDFGSGSGLTLIAASSFASWDFAGFNDILVGRRLRQNFQTFGMTTSAATMKAFVDGQILTLAAKGAQAISNLYLGCGRAGTVGTSDFLDGSNRLAFVVYSSTLSDANAILVRDALDASFGIGKSNSTQIIAVGDSNLYGATVSESLYNVTMSRVIRDGLMFPTDFYSMALSSQLLIGAGQLAASATTREDALAVNGTYANRLLFSMIGGNDLATDSLNGGGTPGFATTLYNAYVAYVAERRTKGFTDIVVATIPTRQVLSVGQAAIEYQNFNTMIRNGKAGADEVADVAADPIYGDAATLNNLNYWQGDKTHHTYRGNQAQGAIAIAAINRALTH